MEEQFIDLVNHYRALIYKVCNLYCHDAESRRDLFQEVVLQLWKSFPSFRNESSKSTWIYKVTLNTAISNFRKESKRVEKATASFALFEVPDISSEPDNAESLTSLRTAINKLSDVEKAIVMLYLDEKTYQQMSEIIGIPISSIGVRINRVKKKLSNLIKTY